MSFSSDVKEELVGHVPSSRHCRLAELAAIVSMLAKVEPENSAVLKKIDKLKRVLDIDIESDEGQRALKLIENDGHYRVDRLLIERSCCKQAFIRGAFLACGSVTNPEKGYHFEIVCDEADKAKLICDIINDFDIDAKIIMRKKSHVVYIKDGSMIVDILNIMGAHVSLMNMENIRILRDMRNSVNRRVNCEAANITKTVNAAVKQIEDIRYIEAVKGLKYLPDNLRVVAELRLEEPETPLKELGEKLSPPLGKSGINHRLRKICEIADELRRN